MVEFTLYVVKSSHRTGAVVEKLKKILEAEFGNAYTLKVYDVFEDSERAANDDIVATPTLIKEIPQPIRKVLGDLGDKDILFQGLGIRTAAGGHRQN